MARKVQATGYNYVPSPGEAYYPNGKPGSESGEQVKVLNENGGAALIQDKDGNTRVVPKGWLRR